MAKGKVKTVNVVGDIHGQIKYFEEVIKGKRNLILLGDYVDLGLNSKEVLYKVRGLLKSPTNRAILGNHDEQFLRFLTTNLDEVWHIQWLEEKSYQTYESFLPKTHMKQFDDIINLYKKYGNDLFNDYKNFKKVNDKWLKIREYMWDKHESVLVMLSKLPIYIEEGEYVFVHAGVDLRKNSKEWWKTPSNRMMRVFKEFINEENKTNKTFVVGHTSSYRASRELGLGQHHGILDLSKDKKHRKIFCDNGSPFKKLELLTLKIKV